MTNFQEWLLYCCIAGVLATLQMSAVTGDLASQAIMFPIYGLLYGSLLFGLVKGFRKLMGKS